MKGKVLNLKIVVTLLIALTASFSLVINFRSKTHNNQEAYAATPIATLDGEDYRALFNGDVIFSVEKVAVSSRGENNNFFVPDALDGADKTFHATYDETIDNETYTFKNIPSKSGNKTVVEDGKFVRLDNIFNGEQFEIDTGIQEAVMISFGAYVLDGEEVKVAENDASATDLIDNTIYAGITYLEVVVTKNGEEQTIPSIRNIQLKTGGLYFDFAYLITQQEDNSNEGYYQISLRYIVNGVEYSASFEFYMVNNSSYKKVLDETFGYNANPTLGWTSDSDFAQTKEHDDYVRYYIGKDGVSNEEISYPTITYDYTRYKLSYVQTANQKTNTYDFDVVNTSKLTSQTATLVMTKTTSGVVTTKEFALDDYDSAESTNLVTIMLTEPGSYVISYEYLYKGYNSVKAPETGFETEDIKLAIHGMSLQYSKEGYEGAKMQYFEIAQKSGNLVDLVIPNGYGIDEDISGLKNKQLGFVYKLVESEEREGNVLCQNSQDSLINQSLKNKTSDGTNNDYSFLTDNIKDTVNFASNESSFEAILNNITYAQTNQGSLWIEGNDSYSSDSFYFYSTTKFEAKNLFKDEVDNNGLATGNKVSLADSFTNTTSFNSKGYYLVFIQIKPNGINTDADSCMYWQVFAFQYTSTSTNITVEAVDDKGTDDTSDDSYEIVAGGKYTNKNVRISWKKPGIFDRNINPYYYSAINLEETKEQSLKVQLLSTTKKELEYYEKTIDDELCFCADLGSEVDDGTFVKYLIRLENEGDSVTYKTFTIDRQDISGIQAYLIQEMFSGSAVSYAYAEQNNTNVPIDNSITDSYATLTWDDKKSGAEIYASYSYTPFVINSDEPTTITGKNGKDWVTTNYGLGETIEGADLKKSSSRYNVSSDCVLFNQGIYLITLRDSAGNVAYYAFVIDKTANYFKIGDTHLSNSSIIFGDDVTYSVGDYKAFKLNANNETLKDFIISASTGKLANAENYYTGTNNNVNALSKLFQQLGEDYYLTVQNTNVVGYKTDESVDSKISGLSGVLEYDKNDTTSYYKRSLYVTGANHKYSTSANNSYVIVEITKDNARGYTYYSNDSGFDNIPHDGNEQSSDGSIRKLTTGSDVFDESENEIGNGLLGAQATSAKHVAFIWKMGTGSFEVATVTYSFFNLKLNSFDGKYYYYGISEEDIPLYENGSFSNGAKALGDGQAMVKFNGSSDTKAGLYVVTRTYKDIDGAELGEDVKTKNYYFIVDRNEIIDVGIGGSIRIELMEDEVEFHEFSTNGLESEILTYIDKDISVENERYNIYLETTKLPATLNIPTGKYYSSSGSSSGYYAGRLTVSVYFRDRFTQLAKGSYQGKTIKIYQSSDFAGEDVFNINIYDYLSNNIVVRDRLTISEENGNWLFLPGDYIIRITDNVVDGTGKTHVKNIGFRIKELPSAPQVEISTGYNNNHADMVELTLTDNKTTVSQEFLEVVLPKYDTTETQKAQVDPNYLVVTQTYDGTTTDYINHPYVMKNGVNLQGTEGKVTINNNGTTDDASDDFTSIWLDTKLRKDDGTIDTENLNKSLSYTITIRYKLNDFDLPYNESSSADYEKYKDCYVYYKDNKKVTYYETTYTITIDREAPSANIDNLNQNDILVQDYNQEFGVTEMMVNDYHDVGSYIYFTKQYAKYYQTNKTDKGYIYAYQVDEQTEFKTDDNYKVYYKKIGSDLSVHNLTLPFNPSSYDKSMKVQNIGSDNGKKYYSTFLTTSDCYYEIIEEDEAGNTTQYVVYYKVEDTNVKIPTEIKTTHNEDQQVNIIDTTLINDSDEISAWNIYAISANGAVETNDNFFKVEIKRINNGEVIYSSLTNATTNLTNLTREIVDAINNVQSGNFKLILTTRTQSYESQINLYNLSSSEALRAEDLITIDENGKYYIVLDKANKVTDDVTYFATEITVESSDGTTSNYLGKFDDNGKIKYYVDGVGDAIPQVLCSDNTTYFIKLTDVFGNEDNHRFNTSGQEFIIFESEKGFYEDVISSGGLNETYLYSYTNSNFKYDNTIYLGKVYKKNGNVYSLDSDSVVSNGIYNTITINAPYNEETGSGDICEYKIELYCDGVLEETYYIIIDTRLTSVAVRDYATGEQRDIISYHNNQSYEDVKPSSDSTASGIMNLHWSEIEENDYFYYEYTLYELLKDGTYRESTLTGQTNTVIATKEDSSGIYKFEIAVYTADGDYAGNRIYAFEVQAVSNQVYYVRDENGEAIKANSTFKVSELSGDIQTKISTKFVNINTNLNLPLYVTNQDLQVIVTVPNVDTIEYPIDAGQFESYYDFTIYQIKKENAYEIYIGILKFDETSSLVNNVAIVGDSTYTVSNQTTFTIPANRTTDVSVQANRATDVSVKNDYLFNKNELLLEVSYMGTSVDTTTFSEAYTISGNGRYTFKFKDLAGNVHTFANESQVLEVDVLREVVVTINEQAVFDNAYYNDEVRLIVVESSKYTTGSISIKAQKNGVDYSPQGYNPYVFSDYGTYRVVISARYKDMEQPLTKTITFTILNVNEARKSIDLTGLSGCTITSVKNHAGDDVTEAFIGMMGNGMNITYENIMAHSDSLNITSGKQTFTMTYSIEDGIYPAREIELSFTLNNEDASISCSLEKGESSTKGFTIYFNAAVIYEKVGEAYVYINDRLIAHVTADSANEEKQISTTYKEYGDGDYYVKLLSSSGVVLDSYKVTIKEPLNTWAIIVIIVVVAVVATVVITIIVLRRKMRIR